MGRRFAGRQGDATECTPHTTRKHAHPLSNADRGFNNPHQAASWYGMYRVARNFDLMPTAQPWDAYL